MCLFPRKISYLKDKENYIYEVLDVPCGKCVECLEQYSREWSFRIMDEAEKYDNSCCVTLTYDDNHLPDDLCVQRRHTQLFLKLLRKHYGKLRYFGCAEYGGKNFRPHYHIILFGVKFDDMFFWCKSKRGGDLFRSPLLERCWSYGYSYVGELSLSTAKYCAKYLQKYAFEKFPELKNRVPPFTFMSTHPGIGGSYEPCLSTDKLYKGGKWVKTPRYYLKRALVNGVDLTALKAVRASRSVMFARSRDELFIAREKISKKLLK